jgi:hypothetical protein
MAGAPQGNKNAAKAKVWTAAIERALARRSATSRKDALEMLADNLLDLCEEGNLQALQELGNRLEGKPNQALILSGDEGKPLKVDTTITPSDAYLRMIGKNV